MEIRPFFSDFGDADFFGGISRVMNRAILGLSDSIIPKTKAM